MKHLAMILASATLVSCGAASGAPMPTLSAAIGGELLTTLGTPYPLDKPEEWTDQNCTKTNKDAWPPFDSASDAIKADYCVVVVEVEPSGRGCSVKTTTPGVIFISPQTKRIFWRLRLTDIPTYRFHANGIVVVNNTKNFKDEPITVADDPKRRFFSVSRQSSENHVYAYDIQIERVADGKVCTGYGPLIINRD